jgi:hypothetical protein
MHKPWCTPARHIFRSASPEPPPDHPCQCGATTWRENDTWQEIGKETSSDYGKPGTAAAERRAAAGHRMTELWQEIAVREQEIGALEIELELVPMREVHRDEG